MELIDDSIEHAEGYFIMEYLAVKSLIGKIKAHLKVLNVHFTYRYIWMSMKKFIMRIYFILMTFDISFEPLFYVQGKAEKKPFSGLYNMIIIIT